MANSSSLRSTSSGSSTSSLSSTFSDITSDSSSSSPPNQKTNAFFASPFSTRPPSPSSITHTSAPPPPPPPAASQNNRSLTAEFFGTPATPPDPPASSLSSSSSSKPKTPHLSRIFPSRYTSVSDRHSSDFYFDSINDDPPDFILPRTRDRAPSTGSESSSLHSPRLPTPPPLQPHTPHREDTITLSNFTPTITATPKDQQHQDHLEESYEEPTPRPASLQPGLLRFERELILQAQAQQRLKELSKPPPPPPVPEPPKLREEEGDGLEDEEPHPGSIISLPSPSMRPHSQTNSSSQSRSHLPLLPVSPLSLTFTIASPSPTYAYSSRPHPLDRETPTPTNANESSSSASLTRNSSLDEMKPLPSPPPLTASSSNSHISQLNLQSSLLSPKRDDQPPPQQQQQQEEQAPKLRLLRPLGHGAFSAVWLAEDLSRVPLTLVSKKSVRDLRRRASGRRDKEKERELERDRAKELGREKERERGRETETETEMETERKKEEKEGTGWDEHWDGDGDGDVVMQDRTESGTDVEVGVGVGVVQGSERGVEGDADVSRKQQQQRPPSTNTSRLKEGLRNMWSFSRSAATTVIGGPASASASCAPAPIPASTAVSITPPASMPVGEEKKDEECGLAGDDGSGSCSGAGNAPSRSSSTKSMTTTSSMSLSLSRQSSARQGQGGPPSRSNASLMTQQYPHAHQPLHQQLQQGMTLSRDSSLKKFRERVKGTRPAFVLGRTYLDERDGEMGRPRPGERERERESWVGSRGGEDVGVVLGESGIGNDNDNESEGGGDVGLGASLSRHSSLGTTNAHIGMRQSHHHQGHGFGYPYSYSYSYSGRLVAVKMTPRRPQGAVVGREREEEERTRVGFVREVEVLKHISHPNITPLLAHLSTASRHILVLPYLPGGDLLGLVNNDVAWGMLGESVLRRIWCEICKAVGWMHGVGLVHRDIKLENVLLTTSAFSSLTPSSPRPTLATLPASPSPFVKLTDFGLSRFVEIDAKGEAELLSTRCGSEAYAAPELVTGGGGGAGPGAGGVYDARKTDAWACGVVLFALVGRQLPFGEGVEVAGGGGGGGGREKSRCRIGGERGKDEEQRGGGVVPRRTSLADRRHWLMRIARGEWEWPGREDGEEEEEEEEEEGQDPQRRRRQQQQPQGDELVGPQLVKSRGAKRIVSRLLVRDPKKRARVVDLWDDAWMQGGEDEVWWREREMNMNSGSNPADVDMDGARLGGNQNSSWTFDGDGQELRADVEVGFYDEPPSYPGPLDAVEGGEDWQADTGLGVEGEDDEDDDQDEDDEDDEDEQDGCLFDHEPIDNITRQEVI